MTIRVLFVARYRDQTMERKLVLLAQEPGLTIRHIRPRAWEDEFGRVEQGDGAGAFERIALAMFGRPTDPHRALYQTLDFSMRGFQPDLIHAEEEPDSLAALQIATARRLWAPRAKLILHTWQNIDRPRNATVRWVTRQTLAAADAIFCANREAAAILERHRYRGAIHVLPAVGVDMQTFLPCPARPAHAGLVVGYVGRMVPEKGIETLIEAACALGEGIEVILIGEGPQRAALEAQVHARQLTNRVHFYPPAPPGQVAQQICQLDVLVLPSRTTRVWKEQFGRVLVEAMACQIPVVGSDSGAIPEVIGDAGLVFPEGDAAALADCLRRLEASPELRRELAGRGYERAKRLFSQEHIARQTARIYRQMIEQPRAEKARAR
jgi:glycosyltransferase involved in cell wall biosynthesis